MKFKIYMTEGCHLCDEAIELIAAVNPSLLREIDPVDIVYDDQLMDTYQADIPVLEDLGSGQQLRWPFDQADVAQFISRAD